ncbi:ATP-dependent DNA helicase RecQ [Clavibacter michiganensis]|uniref:DNA 3'-5' helicase n=1 Tax=Clavibacter michiganensis TaxID=28447 RepID=A0A251XPD9_9MICO|nr:ATP-dependent DNA helicase RecQ [Clavibacter michiganensis]
MKQNRTAEGSTRTTATTTAEAPDEGAAAAEDAAIVPPPEPGPDPEEALRVAREAFGWDELHDGQVRTIGPLVRGRDALVVMPTGYGKSAIYQVATVLLDGLTVVVSPLIALQADQVQNLEEAPAAPPARVINSTVRGTALDEAWATVEEPGARIVFLTPSSWRATRSSSGWCGAACPSWSSTRRTAWRPGATTSAPTTWGSAA